MLLVHGLNGFKEGWGRLPGALAGAGLRVVAPDLPGFGATPGAAPHHARRRLADALRPLVERLAPVALVGHSLGTQVAMLAAAGHPARCAARAAVPLGAPAPAALPAARVSPTCCSSRWWGAPSRAWRSRACGAAPSGAARPTSARRPPGAARGRPRVVALLELASERLLDADLRRDGRLGGERDGPRRAPARAGLPQPTLVVSGHRATA